MKQPDKLGILLIAFCLSLVCFISGCDSQYYSERLYWQANQLTKSIAQDKPLEHLTSQDYQRIISAFSKVVDKYPLQIHAAQSRFIIAKLYSLQKKYPEAREELTNIIHNFSNISKIASRAQFMIATLYRIEGDWERALTEYEKVTDLYPLSRLGLSTPIYIAEYYKRTQNEARTEVAYDKAIRTYQEIISEYSGTSVTPSIMEYLALAYLNQGKWDKAIEVWETITSEYSESPTAAKSLLSSGEIYATQIKDLDKAIQAYEGFVKQYPSSKVIKQVEFQIGKLYFQKDDTKKAKEVFLGIIKNYPEETELCANARFNLASCYEKEGDTSQTITQYEQLKKDYPKTKLGLSVPFFLARYYLINGQQDKATAAFAQAISEYKAVIDKTGDSSLVIEAGRLISLCLIQQEKWQEAIDYLYKLTQDFPEKPEAQLFLLNVAAIYERELNQPQRAIKIYQEMIERYPEGRFVNLAKIQLESLQQVLSGQMGE